MTAILPFTLHGEDFGFPAAQVREVIKLKNVTHTPLCGNIMIGITMLRGDVVTLFDLTAPLNLPRRINSGAIAIILTYRDDLYGFPVDSIAGLRLSDDERPLTIVDIPDLVEKVSI